MPQQDARSLDVPSTATASHVECIKNDDNGAIITGSSNHDDISPTNDQQHATSSDRARALQLLHAVDMHQQARVHLVQSLQQLVQHHRPTPATPPYASAALLEIERLDGIIRAQDRYTACIYTDSCLIVHLPHEASDLRNHITPASWMMMPNTTHLTTS